MTAVILSGFLVQRKGRGSALASKRLMAACKTTSEKAPRFRHSLVSLAQKPSMALSHDVEVGVKWKVKRGGEQGGGAVPDVVVGHGATAPLLQRQAGWARSSV
jgi:hypothetical protein